MSLSHGTSIIRGGLVFHYDMSNTQKSWKGPPATNLCLNGEGVYTSGNVPNNWALEQGFGGLTPINQTSSIDRYGYGYFQFTVSGTTTVNNRLLISPVHFAGSSSAVTPGLLYSFSYNIDNIYNYTYGIQATYLWYDSSNVFLSASYGAAYSSISGWSRKTDTVTAPVNAAKVTTRFDFINYGTVGTTVNFTLRLGGIQWEVGSYSTPYIKTTNATASRSNTQSIIDLTLKNTVTANSLTYASDNTFSFNGTSDYIDCGTIPQIGSSLTGLTVEAWVYPTSSSTRCIIENGSGYTTNTFYLFQENATNFTFTVYGTTYDVVYSNFTYELNKWYHLVGTWLSGGRSQIYANGVNCSGTKQGAMQTALINGNTNIIVGARAGSSYQYSGKIPMVKLYNRSLSAAEVRQNFEALRGRYGI